MSADITKTLRSDHEVRNERGTLLQTFEAADMARAWARANCETFGPLSVEAVEVTEKRQRIYRAKPKPEKASVSLSLREGEAA